MTDDQLVELIRKHFKLTPKGIIETLNLRRPIYRETARHGHFGRELPPSPGRRPTRPTRCARKQANRRWRHVDFRRLRLADVDRCRIKVC